MAAPRPNVYMFEKDHEAIKDLVRSLPGGETVASGGDLFGLWTDDGEPVVHLVTGQAGRENQQTAEPSERIKKMRIILRDKYWLPRIGKWQNMRDTEENRNKIKEALRVDKALFNLKTPPDFVLIIMVNDDNSTGKMELSPFLVPQGKAWVKGTVTLLGGENVFRKVPAVRETVGDLLLQNGGRNERESDPEVFKRKNDFASNSEKRKLPTPPDQSAVTSHDYPPSGVNASEIHYDYIAGERQGFRSSQTKDLKVFMFQEDLEMMSKLVLRCPNVETGGDLFGLWTTEGDAVLHIVLGPGKDCSRTDVSFNQDIPYLQRNGELLTNKYMLCHIGEWHSHHQMHLFHPSQGDSSTVIRHYPRGTSGFLLIIANIRGPDHVMFSPYLYTEESRSTYTKSGDVIPLRNENVFKKTKEIENSIKQGKETKRQVEVQRAMAYPMVTSHPHRNQPPRSTHSKAQNSTVEPMDCSASSTNEK